MIAKGLIVFWFVLLSIPFSMMMGAHTLSLKPSKSGNLKDLNGRSSWTIMHFLNPECGCSEKVFKSLAGRHPKTKNIEEKVFVLGKKPEWVNTLKARGYSVVTDTMDYYSEKYQINAVPQLVIIDEGKKLHYSGGYSSKRGPASIVEDEEIFKQVASNKSTVERPIYGCVNGSDNQKKTDLIGYKYEN